MIIDGRPNVKLSVTLELTETEARALEALGGYGEDAFIEHFYEHLGKTYMADHVTALRSFLSGTKKLKALLDRTDEARKGGCVSQKVQGREMSTGFQSASQLAESEREIGDYLHAQRERALASEVLHSEAQRDPRRGRKPHQRPKSDAQKPWNRVNVPMRLYLCDSAKATLAELKAKTLGS